jgi:preprotein translocase subunit Sss1
VVLTMTAPQDTQPLFEEFGVTVVVAEASLAFIGFIGLLLLGKLQVGLSQEPL